MSNSGRILHLRARASYLVIIAFGLFFGISLCEVLLRATRFWEYVDYDKRAYFGGAPFFSVPYALKPLQNTHFLGRSIHTNTFGMRDKREFLPADPSRYRILLIGDSTTFGFGVGDDETIGHHLEQLLNSSRAKPDSDRLFEVINAGVDGYDVVDESFVLSSLVSLYRPDFVIWYIGPNDWDDSLSLNPSGTLSSSAPSYAASSAWLELTWGLTRPYYDTGDFRRVMSPASVAWAEKRAVPVERSFSSFLGVLEPYSRFAGLLKNRLGQYRKADAESGPAGEGLMITPLFKGETIGSFNSIYFSPYHTNRFSRAIARGAESARKGDAGFLIMTHASVPDVPADHEISTSIADVFDYLPMNSMEFSRRHSLGWDPHYTTDGNKLLASAFASAFSERNTEVPHLERLQKRDRKVAREQFAKARAEYGTSAISHEIDLQNFKNIHQLIGGLYPPRRIPIKGGADVWILLRRRAGKDFTVEGENYLDRPVEILSRFFSDHNSEFASSTANPGKFRLQIPLEKTSLEDALYSVSLSMEDSPDESVQLNRVAFE